MYLTEPMKYMNTFHIKIKKRKEEKQMKKQVPENPGKNRIGKNEWLVVVTALTITCYITSNLMAVKLLNLGGIIMDAGTITFPIAYMLGDILTEIWGFKTARKVIFLTFLCNLFLITFTYIGVILPSPDYVMETTEAYRMVFCVAPRILLASSIGFIAGELSNAWVMTVVKEKTKGKFLFVRTIVSSAVGYVFDTVLFVLIAFLYTCPLKDIVTMVITQYLIKLFVEAIFATPLVYAAVAFLKNKIE